MAISDRLAALSSMDDAARRRWFKKLSDAEKAQLLYDWGIWARTEQLAPPGDWRIWIIMAGRGFGKTRAGAEWVRETVRRNPEARIALVGATIDEVRRVMVEGDSGVMAIAPPGQQPNFEPSLKRLTWPGGAQAFLYSAAEPEALRGPQHSHAWCDEIAKWDNVADRATRLWDNLIMGLRLGERPRVLATTTPRPAVLLRRLVEQASDDTIVTTGTTYDNASNLPTRFLTEMRRDYAGTALGRQELEGALLSDVEGALWTRELLDRVRKPGLGDPLKRVVVGVDPPASAAGDECGIVVCGLTELGKGRVLADASVAKARPERWAKAVAKAAHNWNADRVVAEANQGGAMVESVLRAADIALPVKLVHATRSKAARAEPVAALYEAGRVEHGGLFPALEDQLCGLMAGGGYEGPGRSPDRADALVWAMTELMLARRSRPRIVTV